MNERRGETTRCCLRRRRRVGSERAARLGIVCVRMAFDAAANTAWLGAVVTIAGVSTPLPARLIKLLEVAFGDDLYTEGDVPDATDVLVEEDIKARLLVWNAVIDDVCKAQTSIVLSSEKLRFAAWFRALYQGVVTMDASQKLVVITKEMAADLSAQQMTTLGELGAFELALALGRAVGPEEVDGFNCGSPYMHMVGAIRSAKANKGSGRGKNLDTLLGEALISGDKSDVKRFFTDLCHRLTNSNLMPCFARAAIQILTFVNKADQNIRDDLAWIIYMIEVRMKYMGRGIPIPFDVELSISAKETAEDKRRKGTGPRGIIVLDGAGVSRSTTRECLAEMLTPAPSSGGAGLVAALSDLQVGLVDIGARLDGFGARLEKLEGSGTPGPKSKCWICQSDGHLAATCSTAKGKELREKKLASAIKPAAEAK